MTKLQLSVIGAAILLFLVLYVGCEIVPRDMQALEKTRAVAVESTNLDVLLQKAKADLPAADLTAVLALEQQLEEALTDSVRLPILKDLSGQWFTFGEPAIAGTYAEQVAQVLATEESWSIAGTTFTICVQRSEEEKERNYCTDHAVTAYESAISLNPANSAHKVNLALLYAENPPADNPMRGISMLLDLNRQDPRDVLVLNSLGRLAIKTGQYERAIERLEEAQAVDSQNANTICLLSQAYEGAGDPERAQQYQERCRNLTEIAPE